MTIKEIAARTGVSADTLRYYERMGIIPAVPRTSGGVRNYDENFVEWVAFIQTLKDVLHNRPFLIYNLAQSFFQAILGLIVSIYPMYCLSLIHI